MRILHCIDSLDYGGAETLLMSYIPLLTEHEHVVVTLRGPNVFPKTNYEYIQLNSSPVKGFFHLVYTLKKIIREKNIDTIHSHSYWSNLISRLAAPRNKKLVNHYHFADYDTGKHKFSVKRMIWMDRMIPHKNLVRIGVSAYVGSILQQTFPGARIKVIPNFINCIPASKTIKSRKDATIKIVAVGNCNSEKNYDFLIKVFKSLGDQPVHIDIFGGGEKLNDYRKEVEKLGIQNMKFCGVEPGVRQKLPEYDLFLSASVSETFGIAILEAICAKLPLMLSDIPAFHEIAPGSCRFFNPHDKNDLIEKIRDVVKEHDTNYDQDYDAVIQQYSKDTFLFALRNLYKN